jgi:hypothetical protein
MVYFSSRDIVAISMCAALWGVLNVTISPVFWTMTHLPFACDLIGFTCLIIAVWWTKKLGTATAVGFIATAINLILRPTALHFIAFTVASVLFDITTRLVGYKTCFSNPKSSSVSLVALSVISGAVAGSIIGNFFMTPGIITNVYGTVWLFASLHATGGLIGGVLGFILVKALELRGVLVAQTG